MGNKQGFRTSVIGVSESIAGSGGGTEQRPRSRNRDRDVDENAMPCRRGSWNLEGRTDYGGRRIIDAASHWHGLSLATLHWALWAPTFFLQICGLLCRPSISQIGLPVSWLGCCCALVLGYRGQYFFLMGSRLVKKNARIRGGLATDPGGVQPPDDPLPSKRK